MGYFVDSLKMVGAVRHDGLGRETIPLAVLTNARFSNQPSMIGYGELVMQAALRHTSDARELRAVSVTLGALPNEYRFGRLGKIARNLDRMVLSPAAFAGQRANVVHVVDPGHVPYLDLIRHRASVVTVHDMIPHLALAGRLSGMTPTDAGRRLMSHIVDGIRRATRIVCVSEATRRDVCSITGCDFDRTVLIPNCVFQPLKPAPADSVASLRSEWEVPAAAPLVLHVGFGFYKNRDAILRIFAEIRRARPDAILVLVGGLSDPMKELVVRLGIPRHAIRDPRNVPRERMQVIYSAASVLLFPSLYEGFGYPVLEAQLCSTAVVCSDAGALPEVAGEGAVVLPPTDEQAMAEAVLEILDDPRLAATLTEKGLANAARFDTASWFEAHRRLYDELMPDARS